MLFTLGALVGGCSAVSPQVAGSEQQKQPPVAVAEEKLPKVDLSADLLYRILLAEVAGQRGNLQISAESYLRAATQTRDPRLARRSTQISLFSRNFELAMRSARLWVEIAPDETDARQALAALLIRDGQGDQALVHLREVIKLTPGGADHGYLVIARLLTTEQDKPRALAIMEQLVKEDADTPNAVYAYASVAAQSGAPQKALESLDRLLAREPGNAQALVLRAAVLTQLGRKEEGIVDYGKAIEIAPEDANLRLAYARELITAGRLADARDQFRHLSAKLPNNSDVLYAQALLAAEMGDLDEATRDFERLMSLGQRTNEAAFNLGQLAEKQGRAEKAIEWYTSMAPGGPSYVEGQFRYALLISKKNGVEAALAYLDKVAAPDEDRVRLVLAKGDLLRQAERHQEAMALYDNALNGELARNHDLLYARAMAAERIDRLDLMERDLKLVIFEDPNNAQALNALGYTLAERTDRFDEAHDLIARALAREPEDAAVLDSMGWVLYRQGKFQEALDYLRKAIARQKDGEIAGHLGAALWRLGQKEEARKVWDDALKAEPGHKALQAIIDKVTTQ